ncbi:MAG: hypothetical protein PHX83_02770 [Acidobacteriia bacterium]|nr:hypothetical protein [Terriglobia bacterium]
MKTLVKATYDDVNLILKLYDLRREEKLRQARAWFVGSFNFETLADMNTFCPPGSEHNAFFRMVTSYWDMAASFVTSGVLNEQLFFQSNREILLVWERIRELAKQLRAERKDSTLFANLEAVANSYTEYLKNESPGAYEYLSDWFKKIVPR